MASSSDNGSTRRRSSSPQGAGDASRRVTQNPSSRQSAQNQRAQAERRPQTTPRTQATQRAQTRQRPQSNRGSEARPQAQSRQRAQGVSRNASRKAPASHGAKRKTSPVKLILIAVLALLLVFGAGCVADRFINGDKVYSGVSVGELDLSGKTKSEAASLIEEAYAQTLGSARVIVYASEDIVGTVDVETELLEEEALAEQISVEEARANKQIWAVDAESLGATVASDELAEEAFAIGREEGGLLTRLKALVLGVSLEPRCAFDQESLDALYEDWDELSEAVAELD